MNKPKIAIIRFPGTNREKEAFNSSRAAGFDPFYFRWNDDYKILEKAEAFILPGGFSYEDRSRSGIMCALDPLMEVLRKEAKKGKPLLGICNGAQMLIESGMVPGGVEIKTPLMCLARNVRKANDKILGTGFINTWIRMKHDLPEKRSAFTYIMKNSEIIHCPIAHGEGRYTTINKDLIKILEQNNQIVFKYCNGDGKYDKTYPVNPNGALENIASIINPEGNIMAAMPHFEHFAKIGKSVFASMYEYVIDGNNLKNLNVPKLTKIKEDSAKFEITDFKSKPKNIEFLIKLIITDNEAESVKSTILNLGFKDISLNKYLHFEIEHNLSDENILARLEKIIRSGEMLNTNKELIDLRIGKKYFHFSKDKGLIEIKKPVLNNVYLVREIDDYIGESKLSNLKNRLKFDEIENVKRGIVWEIKAKNSKDIDKIIETRIFHNPHAQTINKYTSV